MIEYFLNTGNSPNSDLYNIFGFVTNGAGSIDSRNPLTNDVYINGATLLETIPQITTIANVDIINNSGDFFLSGLSLRSEDGFTDFIDYETNRLKFDFISSGEHEFYESDVHLDLITGFSGQAQNLSNKNAFLNGIKLVSGENYQLDSNSNFEWIDSDNEITGLLFTMPNRNDIYYSGQYDILGVKFNKGTTVSYLNGQRFDEEDFLETASVNKDLINTGLEGQIEFTGVAGTSSQHQVFITSDQIGVNTFENDRFITRISIGDLEILEQ